MATQTKHTFSTRIDIADASRDELVALLNARLADTFDLYSQLKQAHWNVKGSDFIQLHELYDLVAESVLEYVDTIAERAGALGGAAEGTIQIAVEHSFLHRYKLGIDAAEAHIAGVTAALATFGESLRSAIDETAAFGDADTSDVFTEISRGVDQQLWFVESHRQP